MFGSTLCFGDTGNKKLESMTGRLALISSCATSTGVLVLGEQEGVLLNAFVEAAVCKTGGTSPGNGKPGRGVG